MTESASSFRREVHHTNINQSVLDKFAKFYQLKTVFANFSTTEINHFQRFCSRILPFLVLVGHKEFVQLLPLELQLVVVVLLDGLGIGNGIILSGKELLQRHHAGLSLHVP